MSTASTPRDHRSLPASGRLDSSGERVPVLDGIRGIAILLVMVFHFWENGTTGPGPHLWQRLYTWGAGMGWTGVDLFFVLSGFLITGILYDARNQPHYFRVFYGRRTVRIFPLYYAALIFFFVVVPFVLAHVHHGISSAMRDSIHTNPAGKFFAWTYTVNWYEGFRGWGAIPHPLQHFWSLAIEEQFYLVWPFLVLRLPRRRLIGVCFGIMALAVTLRGLFFEIHLPIAAYTWTICRADSLAVGAIVALSFRDPSDWKILSTWARRLALPALGALIVVRVLNPNCLAGPGDAPSLSMDTLAISFGGIFFASCIAITMGTPTGSRTRRMLGTPFLRFFGKYSYCLYVCHLPIIAVLAKAGFSNDQLAHRLHTNDFVGALLVNAIGFAASLTVALASWHLYEKQWLKLKDLPALRRRDALPAQAPGHV
ncbi:MAG TPA: acyltransferase [Acidobacteriaceae bacterium]|jgi:peptidoglycan/LPS O-acetylase OafA/YrhL|nr:acyltransferase [Acidobacteriaceae bacterium]